MLFYLEHWGGARVVLRSAPSSNVWQLGIFLRPPLAAPKLHAGAAGVGELLHETADQPGPNLHGHGLFEAPDDLSLHAVKILILADTWVCLTDCRGELPAKLSNGAEEHEAAGGPGTHPPPDTSRHSNLKRGHPRR